MTKFKVLIADSRHSHYKIETEILAEIGADLIIKDCKNEYELADNVKDIDGILVNLVPVTADVIKNCNRCRVISRYGVGYDNVDVIEAKKKNIYVCNVPDYCTEDVSDHAVALLLSCIRQTSYRTAAIKKGDWDLSKKNKIYRIKDKVIGLIGYGRIAREFHRKLIGFGLKKILVFDPYISKITAKNNNIVLTDIQTLLKESDYISIHCQLNKKTKHLISKKELDLMKDSSIIINTSRGPIIDEEALYTALNNGNIAGAGLDVFEKEPIKIDNPLLKLNNVVLTDHTAWYSEESIIELKTKAAQNVKDTLQGKIPRYLIKEFKV